MAGETTAVSALARRTYKDAKTFGAFMPEFDLTFGSTDNQLADVMEAGYIGPGVTVYGAIWQPTDMDTNVSPAVIHKVTVGTTDVVTGLTGAQSGTTQIVGASSFVTTTDVTKVTVTTTTAAATAAAGTAKLVLLCNKG